MEVVRSEQDISSNEEQGGLSTRASDLGGAGFVRSERDKVNNQ